MTERGFRGYSTAVIKTKSPKQQKQEQPARPREKANGAGRSDGDGAGHGESLERVLRDVTAESDEAPVEESLPVSCPYCDEQFEVQVNSSQDGMVLSESCQVCCRPVALNVSFEDGELQVDASRA